MSDTNNTNTKKKMTPKRLQDDLYNNNSKPTLGQLKAAQTPAARKAAIKNIMSNKVRAANFPLHSEYAQNVIIIWEIDYMNYLASLDPKTIAPVATITPPWSN